jgi:hypothetical protein
VKRRRKLRRRAEKRNKRKEIDLKVGKHDHIVCCKFLFHYLTKNHLAIL